MKGVDFTRCTARDLSRAIDALSRLGHHGQATLFQAVLNGEVGLVWVSGRRAALSAELSADLPAGRPIIVAIGDDDFRATGPAGWRCARAAVSWARSVMVAAGKDNPAHYRALIDATKVTGRGLLIETDADHVIPWAALLGDKAAVLVMPAPLTHPRQKETVH